MVYWDLLIVLVPRIASNGNNQQAHYSSGWLHHKMAWLAVILNPLHTNLQNLSKILQGCTTLSLMRADGQGEQAGCQ